MITRTAKRYPPVDRRRVKSLMTRSGARTHYYRPTAEVAVASSSSSSGESGGEPAHFAYITRRPATRLCNFVLFFLFRRRRHRRSSSVSLDRRFLYSGFFFFSVRPGPISCRPSRAHASSPSLYRRAVSFIYLFICCVPMPRFSTKLPASTVSRARARAVAALSRPRRPSSVR